MSYVCDNCGKKSIHGHSQQHRRGVAGKRWKKRAQITLRLFKPNLQWANLYLAGKKVRMRLCTKCLKKFKEKNKTYSVVNSTLG